MADVEEDAEFGSHFLDSMLEVEMTEEDNELDVSKNDDPLDTLPPIPTFDLQSETISYKDVYRSAVPQPVIASLPLAASNASNIPLVLKPSSMLIYSGEGPPSKPAPQPIVTSVQRIPSKPNVTNPTKKLNVSLEVSNKTDVREPSLKFIQDVFKVEFVKNVFVKADPPRDISLVSDEEMKYYNDCFKDVTKVQNCRLHCTICDKHLGCAVTVEKKINVHTMLKVLTCKPCFEFYGDGNFPCDKGDNCEIYCRWCGQGGALVCCSFCPSVFCKRCVKRNFGPNFLKSLEKASDWACFCCAQKPLWPHRAVCRALLEFIEKKKTDPKTPLKDTSSCCKAAGLTRKKLREAMEKNKPATSQPQPPQLKVAPAAKTPEPKNKAPAPAPPKAGRGGGRLLLKPIVQLKARDRVKIPLSPNGNSRPSAIASIFSPRSVITGNSIIRGITTSGPTKLISAFPSPQLIQSPVLHGETLITPPSRLLVQAKAPATPAHNSSFVRVSLTHQAPHLDVNKMPTVKIPHEVQGLVLRLIFPDNKMHYVRLAPDGTGCKASKDFPMPQFKEKGASFVEENMAEAFKISKMLYDKLLRIREKVNSRTKFTEESVFNSSVKKLHLAYEKTMELFKELDKTLLENHEEWKKEGKNAVDVIDISDDETMATKKSKQNRYADIREKCKKLSDDSDIEILDDIVVNGKTPSNNNNFKEKYRLRRTSDQGKTHVNSKGPGRKRKRGRLRKNNKRLKVAKMQNGQQEEEEEEAGAEEEDPLRIDTVVPTKCSPDARGRPRLGETESESPTGKKKSRKGGSVGGETGVGTAKGQEGKPDARERAAAKTGNAKERTSGTSSAGAESSGPALA